MNNYYNPRFLAVFRTFSRGISLTILAIGILVLIGWVFDIPTLGQIRPHEVDMQANSAAAFVLSGIVLWLINRDKLGPSSLLVRYTFAALVALIGLLTLAEYLFGWNLGIDQMLLRDLRTPADAFPGRMSIASAINFSALGVALLLLDGRVGRLYPAAQPLALIVGSIASIAFIGHLFEDQSLHGVEIYSTQALTSALNFVLLAIGLVCARPERGFIGILASETYGGRALRRLLPFTLSLPMLIAWLGLLGRNTGFYDTRFGLILLVTAMALLLSLTAWMTSAWLHGLDSQRRQAEEALRQSEEQFQHAFEYSAIGMALVAPDGRWLRVNEALCRLCGYSAEELLTKTFQDITHPQDLETGIAYLRQMLGGEILTHRIEKRYIHKAGHAISVLINVSLVRDHQNRPLFFITQVEDITERKRAEERVAYQAHLLENVHDIVIATDTQFNLTAWNHAAEEIYGCKADEALGRNVDDVIRSEFSKAQRTAALRSLHRTGAYHLEILQYHGNGQPFWMEGSTFILRDSNGNVSGYISVGRDVTERKQAEEKLRESEKRFRALIENGSDQVSILAADGSLLYENPSANPTLLYEPGQFLGHDLFQLIHPDDLERARDRFKQLVQDPAVHPRDQFRLRRADGAWCWVEAVGTNLLDEPSVGGIVVNYHDISERRQARDRIETQLRRLEALHTIDLAITGSLDLRLILNVVLKQTTAQLGMDAASVLLLKPYTQAVTYAAGHGFRTRAIEQSRLQPGEGITGMAILHRRTIHQHDPLHSPDFTRAALLAEEGFMEYYAAPLIAKGSVVGLLEVFHRAPFEGDDQWKMFLETLARQTAIAIDSAHLFESLQRSNQDLMLAYDTTIEGWSAALDMRDKETEGHTQRVTNLTLELARAMGIPAAEHIHIRRGALLHDIGKMGVPDHILLKPDTLSEEEWDIMRKHPTFAKDLLSQIEFLHPALDIPYCHHEKWDGSGYPRGLKAEQIPIAARLFAIADVYDALTSDRPYRKGWTKDKTLKHIQSQTGTHFDARVVEAFLEMMKERENRVTIQHGFCKVA